MKAFRPDLTEMGQAPVKGQGESISTINRQLVWPLQIFEESFKKLCESLFQRYSELFQLESLKMLLRKVLLVLSNILQVEDVTE